MAELHFRQRVALLEVCSRQRGGPPEEDVGGENGFEDRENLKQGEENFEEGRNEGGSGFGFE